MENKNLNVIETKLRKSFPDLFQKLERHKGITGFISILGNDPRVKVFCRYDHVQRVVKLTDWLLSIFHGRDHHKSLFLAFFHDINRLPFAHSLEKKVGFDQAKNIRSYLRSCKDNIPDEYISDLESVINKKVQNSPEARLVYAADVAEGFIEDPLFALVTLNIPPKFLPEQIVSKLNFKLDSIEFKNILIFLNKLYSENPDKFSSVFGKIVFKYATQFIKSFSDDKMLFIETPEFTELKNILRKNFLEKIIFPINNEKVSQGSRIVKEIAIPYIKYLKKEKIEPFKKLLEMTDQKLLDTSIQLGLISTDSQEYWPKLP